MASPKIRTVIVNATNHEQLATFWGGFLEVDIQEHDKEASIIWLQPDTEATVNLGFQRVPEKSVSTETHLDIEVEELDAAQHRIESLGGSIVKVNRLASGFEWRVAADPNGNLFCIFQDA